MNSLILPCEKLYLAIYTGIYGHLTCCCFNCEAIIETACSTLYFEIRMLRAQRICWHFIKAEDGWPVDVGFANDGNVRPLRVNESERLCAETVVWWMWRKVQITSPKSWKVGLFLPFQRGYLKLLKKSAPRLTAQMRLHPQYKRRDTLVADILRTPGVVRGKKSALHLNNFFCLKHGELAGALSYVCVSLIWRNRCTLQRGARNTEILVMLQYSHLA